MYQCFVRNDYDAVQGTAEMKLGGKCHFWLCVVAVYAMVAVLVFFLSDVSPNNGVEFVKETTKMPIKRSSKHENAFNHLPRI